MFLQNTFIDIMPFQLLFVLLAGFFAALAGMSAGAAEAGGNAGMNLGGRHAEALAEVEGALARQPGDAQLRFLKGLILAERKRNDEAIAVFSGLTRDFPDLPEPYNNLAVLYAAAGQYEQARLMLDKAIRTSPAYATAYDNLGDIHAKLASLAYAKALRRDAAASVPAAALALVRSMGEPQPAIVVRIPATDHLPSIAAVPAPAGPVPAEPPAVAAPLAIPAPAVLTLAAPAPSAPAPPLPEPASANPVAAALPSPDPIPAAPPPVMAMRAAIPGTTADAASAPAAGSGRDAVLATVAAWAKAWSARDVPAYLAFYASDFEPPAGTPRQAWENQRQVRIANKERIEVTFAQPQVEQRGDSATVQFRQTYRSDRFTAKDRKTLVLVRQDGNWKIKKEWTGK